MTQAIFRHIWDCTCGHEAECRHEDQTIGAVYQCQGCKTVWGRVVARRGHQVLLPKGAAYQLSSANPSVAILQTADGPETVKRWSEICVLGGEAN